MRSLVVTNNIVERIDRYRQRLDTPTVMCYN